MTRAIRSRGLLATLVFAERHFAALPVDHSVAPHYGRLLAETRRRRGRKLGTADALIAATAAAHDLTLITRDRDFVGLQSIHTESSEPGRRSVRRRRDHY